MTVSSIYLSQGRFLENIPLLQFRPSSDWFHRYWQPQPFSVFASDRRHTCWSRGSTREVVLGCRGGRGGRRDREGGHSPQSPPPLRHSLPHHLEPPAGPSWSSFWARPRRWWNTRTRQSSRTTGSPPLGTDTGLIEALIRCEYRWYGRTFSSWNEFALSSNNEIIYHCFVSKNFILIYVNVV